MARLIYLLGSRTNVFAVETDEGNIWEIPFYSEDQTFDFFGIPYEDRRTFSRQEYQYEEVRGGPVGYVFFIRRQGMKILGVVVWGPYGVLPSIYPTIEAAIAAAIQDEEFNASSRPVFSLNTHRR